MTISISLFTKDDNFVKAFADLVGYLTAKSDYIKIKRFQKYEITQGEELDLETLMAILESPDSESLIYSEDAFSVDMRYTLASGAQTHLDINFYGKGYKGGHSARDNSSLRVTIGESGLWQARKETFRYTQDSDFDIPEYLRGLEIKGLTVPKHIRGELSGQINRDSEILFLKICGLWEEDHESYIDHGVMYYEYGWPCPLTSQMVYHKNPQEFARDFERIYAKYHWGIPVPLLLLPEMDIWQLSQKEIAELNEYKGFAKRSGKKYPGDYKYVSRRQKFLPEQREEDIMNFLEALDKEKVQKLSKLPPSQIKEKFTEIAEQELVEVRYRDYQEKGAVLITGANLSVWRAYQALEELIE